MSNKMQQTPYGIDAFIKQNRRINWEADYERDEYCIGEESVLQFTLSMAKEIQSAEEKVKTLEAENERLKVNLKTTEDTYRKTYQDSGVTIDQLRDVQSLNAELVEALRPLIEMRRTLRNHFGDEVIVFEYCGVRITHGDLNRAIAALSRAEGGKTE